MVPEPRRLVGRGGRVLTLDLNSSVTSGKTNIAARARRFGPLIAWIAVIFFFSSTAAAASETSRIIGPLLHFLFPSASEETIRQAHFLIRKSAHFTEYAILAFLAVRAFAKTSHRRLREYRFVISIVIVLLIASLDEFNQSFEPSRTSTIRDVGLDLAGGATMVLLLWSVGRWRGSRQPEP